MVLSAPEWKKFKIEMTEKWLNPVKFEKKIYAEADEKYEQFKQSRKIEWEIRKKAGNKVKHWEQAEDPERLGGFRGQKWFAEMLWGLSVLHRSDLKKNPSFSESKWNELYEALKKLGLSREKAFEKWKAIYYALEIDFDIWTDIGPIEVKTLPFGEHDLINIKKTPWDEKPSTFLVILKTCDLKMFEYQLEGWLYGYEIFQLEVEDMRKILGRPRFYSCKIENLRKPKKLLNMLYEISLEKPIPKK